MAESKLKIQSYGTQFNAPQGFMLNGKLSVTVASNNLTVAVKTLAGNDPSAADPVIVRIGDTVRAITAALSITKNAGTAYAGAGSTEMAAKEIDWFAYLHWYPDTSTMYLMFSRIPWVKNFVDFPNFNSTTDGKTALHSGAVANSTDNVEVIGRFAATLSAGAGYTWTVPTFTATNLVQKPIYETRWLTWLPTWVGYSSAPNGTNLVYKIIGDTMHCNFSTDNNGTSNTTAAGQATLPLVSAGGWEVSTGAVIDNGSGVATPGSFQINSGVSLAYVLMYKDASGAAWTASGARNLRGRISYKI